MIPGAEHLAAGLCCSESKLAARHPSAGQWRTKRRLAPSRVVHVRPINSGSEPFDGREMARLLASRGHRESCCPRTRLQVSTGPLTQSTRRIRLSLLAW